ncbi:peptidase P60 [Paludifilum halophilum]|uniref:Peptidase P60 n=2 Tax=Bacilli TaxID=91061 RepID=A0A235B409_9BACL|nr:peptidase P60 [Paludifilum halophilum]
MKVMRLKILLLAWGLGFLALFGLLAFVAIFISNEEDSTGSDGLIGDGGSISVSADVLKHQPMVEKYAKEYGISEYVSTLLAIIQVESGGKLSDVMQSSESLGLPPNSLDTEASIQQGTKYFADLVRSAEASGVDGNAVTQAYNYGGAFIDYVAKRGKQYSFELAQSFAKERSGGSKVTYTNPIAVKKNGGWRYLYGNMFYVDLVSQYFTSPQFDDEIVQIVMDEALKYEGFPYVFGGDNPSTSFDCSGLTQWSYRKAGINLPRTAQQQYDVTEHISLSEAKPGDLVFFHSTYNSGTYVTHVGIYVGNNRMYNAGDPIGYADLTTAYWQKHLIGAGRIKQ